MDRYDLQKSVRPFIDFVDNLTNWYIRRSRRRFWKSQNDDDKIHAYRTLRYVLVQLSKVAAPFTPFISETIYRNLRDETMPESVHLCDFPTANAAARDTALEERMAIAQRAVNLGHNLRKQKNLKVRQPLSRAVIICAVDGFEQRLAPMASVIAEELNVKAVDFASDESKFVTLTAKANFKVLGAKLGPRMKAAAGAILKMAPADIAKVQGGEEVALDLGDGKEPLTLTANDLLIVRQENAGLTVANEGDLSVALDPNLTPDLIAEGIAREFISNVQNLRKEAGFEVDDRIRVTAAADGEVQAAVEAHKGYIADEVLADSIDFAAELDAPKADLNGHACAITVKKSE